ncbi:hypothetical protein CN150_35690 [Sinorhizobium meliloti]|uniref:hypothetical protein n=1 Tax=Rhizobium meliloti TaxID=382 RepID=UPI000FE012A8|nr:hypothetical protein [Sinorhizobium meliloti]RVK85007.1 hypothetical protein CN150_35690 [Sinorhizobium meliloti]
MCALYSLLIPPPTFNIAAGFKEGPGSNDVVSVANGTAALIYVRPDHADRLPRLVEYLSGCEWIGKLYSQGDLASIGQVATQGLAFAVSLRADDQVNQFGVAGRSLVARPAPGKSDRLGCGQHGGLGEFEQAPFLMIEGRGFASGVLCDDDMNVVDIAPTVLAHLGLASPNMDGTPKQRTHQHETAPIYSEIH